MRKRAHLWACLLPCLVLFFGCALARGQTQVPAKSDATGSPFKALRSISGAAGHEANGRFIMDDPRSVFTAGKDPRVIVYFEWEGPLGPHHFEGLWKSPEGRIVLISDFRYEAKGPRFTGYWSMLLADGTPSGEWNLEARIDGEPAGMHSFVITASGSSTSAAPASPPTPQPLSSSDLYRKASEATVRIEKMSVDGASLGKGIGFWIGDGRLLTAFDVVDGASSLRIPLKDGSQLTTDRVIAWNRWQDWALLKFEASGKAFLTRGPNDAPNVGDRCVFLELGPAGAKLADGSVTGKNSFQRAGERLLVASGVTSASFGGPLMDEYGNYVGIMGGSIVPGGDPLKTLELLSDPGPTDRATDWGLTGLAVPQALLPDFSTLSATTTLAELASRGEFLSPVVKTDSIQYATLSGATEKGVANTLMPKNYKRVFSRRDNRAVMFVNWQVVSKEKLNCALRLLNADNKLISESKPREVSLAPGKYVTTTWDIPVGALPPGLYRVDVMLDSKAAWRDFFRVTE